MLVVKQRQKGRLQKKQDTEACTDEVQSKRKYKKKIVPGVGMFVLRVEE